MSSIYVTSFRNFRIPSTFLKRSPSQFWISHQNLRKNNDSPAKYIGSKAAGWKAEYTRIGVPQDDSPWFQPYIVVSSVAVFLIYFCILRDENDIDEKLNLTLYDRIEGLEKAQLTALLEYNLERGIDSEDIKRRISELDSVTKTNAI